MTITIDRRQWLGASAAALATALLPARAWAAGIPKAPVARRMPVTDTYFGTPVTDPYRWMETASDPDWLPFLRGQDATTRATLAAIPGRDALLKRVSALSGDAAITTTVQRAGSRTFYQQRPAGADNYKLFVRENGGVPRVLVDPTTLGTAAAHVSLDWWSASPDGSHIVYGLSAAGSEDSVAQIMAVATAEILPERIAKVQYANPCWLSDGSGFFFNQLTGTKDSVGYYQNSRAMLHRLRTDPAQDTVILARGRNAGVEISMIEFPNVFVTPGSDVALGLLFNGVQSEVTLYTAATADVLAGRPSWRKVCDASDTVTGYALLGRDLYLLANRGAVRGQVVRTPALTPDLKAAAVVLPMGPMVVEALTAARDGVYARLMDGGVQRLRRIAVDGKVGDVALPYDGSIVGMYSSTDADGVLLYLTGWVQPSAIWAVDAGTLAAVDTGLNPQPPFDLSPYVATRAFATAKDGAKVPYAVVMRRDTPRDGKRPTIVEAYGAYQYAQSPTFRARNLAFLDAGGIIVVAGVRGGGEYGREWHAAGRGATKPNSWRDLIAVCEALIAARYTRSASLAIEGGSAGGITVGRAMTERPDLFAVVLSLVGSSNQLRAEFSANGPANIPEFGSVATEAGFRALLAMDAYQSVRPGTRYPAVLLTTGVSDPRVAPWQVGKMTAALQAATTAAKPVLMRVDFDAGHGLGSTRAQSDALQADEFAFVLWQAGVPGYQPSG